MIDVDNKNDFMLNTPELTRRGFLTGAALGVAGALVLPKSARAGAVQTFGGQNGGATVAPQDKKTPLLG